MATKTFLINSVPGSTSAQVRVTLTDDTTDSVIVKLEVISELTGNIGDLVGFFADFTGFTVNDSMTIEQILSSPGTITGTSESTPAVRILFLDDSGSSNDNTTDVDNNVNLNGFLGKPSYNLAVQIGVGGLSGPGGVVDDYQEVSFKLTGAGLDVSDFDTVGVRLQSVGKEGARTGSSKLEGPAIETAPLPFSISGTKYLDANGDGLTAGDAGLGGVTIYIDSDDVAGFSASDIITTTADDGTWSFTNLGSSAIGKSVFEVLPSGYTQTLGQAGYTLTGTDQTGLNFANFKKFDISGTKFLDANGDGLTTGDVGLGGFTIFVDKNGDGIDNDGTSTVTDANGNWSLAGLGIDALGKKVYEVNQSGYVQTLGMEGLTLASTSQNQTGLNFANFKPSGPGVGTIGYWTNKNGLAAWDRLTPNNLVDDPVTAATTKLQGLLIGDFNRNGMTDSDEQTIFYTVTEARAILNTSPAAEGQDARYILTKQLIASWLNVVNGNTYDTPFASIKQDIANGVEWIQNATPDENSDGIGDGSLTIAGSTKLPSSNPRWSTTLGSVGNGNSYGSQIKNVLDYYNNTGAGFAFDRDTNTIGGNLTELASLQAYRSYFG
jgi:hypothetical protein